MTLRFQRMKENSFEERNLQIKTEHVNEVSKDGEMNITMYNIKICNGIFSVLKLRFYLLVTSKWVFGHSIGKT